MKIIETIDVGNNGLYEMLSILIELHNKKPLKFGFSYKQNALKDVCKSFLISTKNWTSPVIVESNDEGTFWNISRKCQNGIRNFLIEFEQS